MKRPPRRDVLRLLREDLVGEVPGQEQAVVGLLGEQVLDRADRLVRAGHVHALLPRVAVDHGLDELGADADGVDERAALGRRAVGRRRVRPRP